METRPLYQVYSIPGFADPFSCLSHFLGAIIFCLLAVSLLRRAELQRERTVALLIYSSSVVSLLLFSGLYHLFSRGEVMRDVLQRLDHAAIFVLIAATFTPVHVVLFEGVWRWGMMLVVWILALIGIVLSIGFLNTIPEHIDLCFYLGMGWFGTVTGGLLWRRFGFRFILPLVFGAFAYTIGAVFDFIREPILINGIIGPHEVFHLAVLAGIALHWKFIHGFADQVVVRCPETSRFSMVRANRLTKP